MYNNNMKVILASASPRRRELIGQTGVDFKVIPSSADENVGEGCSPEDYVMMLAERKARQVAEENEGIILGADTVVVLGGRILGKPASREEAVKTLAALSGRKHTVITGYCVIYGAFHEKMRTGAVRSEVFFNDLEPSLIYDYVATGLCMDKAGSYGVQDGFPLVKRVEGSLSNVIGLPVEELTQVFKEIEDEQYKVSR